MSKAITYYRVSTEEQAQEGQSIATQRKLCHQWAKENGYKIIDEYSDEGKSATNLNRPALKELLARCQKSNGIQAVLVQDTDRWARSTLDHLSTKSLLKKSGVKLISISQPLIDDSPEGNFIDLVLAGTNALQSQITGRKTSKVMEQKAKAGWWPGWAPIGYHNVENPNPSSNLDNRIVIPDPETAPLIKQMFELYSSGSFTLETLTRKMKKLGLKNKQGKHLCKSSINQCLTNHFYYGALPWKDKTFKGKHDPLTTKQIWENCQQIMSDHNHHACRKRKHNYLLRGYAFCNDCGSRFWAAPHKGRTTIKEYYYCNNCRKGTYTDVSDLEKQVEFLFGKVQVTNKYANELIETAQQVLKEFRNSRTSERQAIINRKSAIEKKLRITEDKLISGTLNDNQFKRISSRLEKELSDIEDALENVNGNYMQKLDGIKRLANKAKNIKKTYANADLELKKHYISLFFNQFLVEDGKIKTAIPSRELKPLIKDGKIRVRVKQNWLPGLDSPNKLAS